MFYLKVGSVANKTMITVQNFAAAPQKEGWSRTQISFFFYYMKKKMFSSN